MHRVSTRLSVFFIALLVATTGVSSSQTAQIERWELFSSGIKMALQGTNPGVQQSAILLIIKHGEKLDIKDAVPDLIRHYRNTDDELTKKLALLAIFQIDKESAFDLLLEQLDDQTISVRSEMLKIYSR